MTYYYIEELGMVARDSYSEIADPEIYDANWGWTYDEWSIVDDYRNGIDSSEPEGSPYRFGNYDIMRRIRQISPEEAMKILEGHYTFRLGDFPERWKT